MTTRHAPGYAGHVKILLVLLIELEFVEEVEIFSERYCGSL